MHEEPGPNFPVPPLSCDWILTRACHCSETHCLGDMILVSCSAMGRLLTWHENVLRVDLLEIEPLLVDVHTIEHWQKAILWVQVTHAVCDTLFLILGS